MMYEIDDLFFASVNKEVTIISYSQYADLIKERKLDEEDIIEYIIPLLFFYDYDNYISLYDVQSLYEDFKTVYFDVITDGSKKMYIKQ